MRHFKAPRPLFIRRLGKWYFPLKMTRLQSCYAIGPRITVSFNLLFFGKTTTDLLFLLCNDDEEIWSASAMVLLGITFGGYRLSCTHFVYFLTLQESLIRSYLNAAVVLPDMSRNTSRFVKWSLCDFSSRYELCCVATCAKSSWYYISVLFFHIQGHLEKLFWRELLYKK